MFYLLQWPYGTINSLRRKNANFLSLQEHICYCNGNGNGSTANLQNPQAAKWFRRPAPFKGTLVSI